MIADRVTLDLDYYEDNFRLRAIRAFQGLKRLDITENVRVHISTGGRGLHIQAHLSERLEDDERYVLRRLLNDDDKRIDLDEERGEAGHATDIYWSEKAGNDGEREEMEDIWAALDRLDKQVDPTERVKRLSTQGRKAVFTGTVVSNPGEIEMTDDRAHPWRFD